MLDFNDYSISAAPAKTDFAELKASLPRIEEAVPGLQKKTADELAGPCPFCGGEDRFIVWPGKQRFWCRQCESKGDKIDFYTKYDGITTKELIESQRAKQRQAHGQTAPGKTLVENLPQASNGKARDLAAARKSKVVKTYDYTDESGNLLFQVCRMEPKSFRQRHPNGNGWTWNLKGVRRVLYHISEVIQAEEVLLVEGEKDADNLRTLGFTATTVPGGAGKWCDDYTMALIDKAIVILPDNDDPGHKHAEKIAKALDGRAKSVKVVELPGLPAKGDVSDFLSTFKDKTEAAERLSIIIDGAGQWEVNPSYESALLDIPTLHRIEIARRRIYLNPWLKEDAIILVSGWRGVGKTFFVLGLLDAVTSDSQFGPWECETSVPCALFDAEMPIADIEERSKQLNLNRPRKNPLYIMSDAYVSKLGLPRMDLTSSEWRNATEDLLISKNIKCWVADNIASMAGGLDENSRQDWDPINQWLLRLRFAGITTILLHHVGKAGQQRGTSAREDNLDCSIILKSPPNYSPEEGTRFITHFTKARVRSSELGFISDTELSLVTTEDGHQVFTHKNVNADIRNRILVMLDEGLKQIEVADALQINRGQVSKARAKAIKEGLLTDKNKLTQTGFLDVSNGNMGGNI